MTENRDFAPGQGTPDGQPDRDPRLAWFASGGQYDKAVPSWQMVNALEDVTGHSGRPPGTATPDEVTGILAGWAAAESRAAARKLAAVRELIRRNASGRQDAPGPGDLPAQWDFDVAHEVAAALGLSWQAADPLVTLAWDLEGRFPRVGRLLDDGILNWQKAKIICDEFAVLNDSLTERAELELLGRILDAGGRLRDEMTPAKIRRICELIVCGTDPAGSRERREQAERDHARVAFYRDHGGAATLFATGLPTDESLRAEASIQKRAGEYRAAGLYPDDKMDLLRVLALVDSINGRSLQDRIAMYRAEQDDLVRRAQEESARQRGGHGTGTGPGYDNSGDDNSGDDSPGEPGEPDDSDGPSGDDGCGDDEPGGGHDIDGDDEGGSGPDDDDDPFGDDGPGGPGGPGPNDDGSGGTGGPGGVPAGRPDPGLASLAHLTLPLATLGGLAERPGEATGYGALDPELARRLAAAAAASDRSKFCLTITEDTTGYAVAHGCARLIRGTGQSRDPGRPPSRDGPPPADWDLTLDRSRAGPDGGYGAWILHLPGGRQYRIDLHTVPVHECDHRYATDAYRPSPLLRHLVEVRDGECTSVSCSMPAWRCDFEHATPHDQGGSTDACNADARSRRCHRVKQAQGWQVSQPRPGWHRWQAPSGRAYTKGPKSYPS